MFKTSFQRCLSLASGYPPLVSCQADLSDERHEAHSERFHLLLSYGLGGQTSGLDLPRLLDLPGLLDLHPAILVDHLLGWGSPST